MSKNISEQIIKNEKSKNMHSYKQKRYLLDLAISLLGAAGLILFSQVALAESPHKSEHNISSADSNHIPKPIDATPALQISDSPDLKSLIPELAKNQIIFVGEIHTRYDHHLTQLEIIGRLHALHPDLVIGMESFQQPFQKHLDEYVRGDLDEREMLRLTEYYDRWRYDYRLYAPILRFAQEHDIPVLALNIPTELSRKVGRSGLDSLTEDERDQLPEDIDRTNKDYENRLKEIFNQHSGGQAEDFDNFLTAQLLWDEGMAETIADYLEAHPEAKMVVLAGRGHLAYGSGIPNRVTRRLPVSTAIVLNGWEDSIQPGLADVLLLPEEQVLPKAGKIGAMLDEEEAKAKVSIASCVPDSACAKAGVKKGDQILSINEQKITNLANLRVMMWDKKPGDEISLMIKRPHWFSSPEELSLRLTLQ